MPFRITLLVLAATAVIPTLVDTRAGSAGVQPALQETVLAQLDPGANLETLTYDVRAYRHIAWVSGKKKAQRLVLDGVPGPVADEVFLPTFSPDGSRIAYAGKRGKDWYVVLDGREHGPYGGRPSHLQFSPDSRRDAWAVHAGAAVLEFVIDGKVNGPFEPALNSIYSMTPDLAFSPDSRRVAFRARMREGGKTVERIVVDGNTGPPFRFVGRPHFSPDSQHLAYWARQDGADRLQLMVDDKPVAQSAKGSAEVLVGLDNILTDYGMPFAPDAARLAYVNERAMKYLPVIHGKELWPSGWMGRVVFTPDFTRWAVLLGDERADSKVMGSIAQAFGGGRTHRPIIHWRLVVDGVEKTAGPAPTGPPVFSPDGGRLVYPAERAVVVDGTPAPCDGRVGDESLVFSPDGMRLAFALQEGKVWRVLVDGKAGRSREKLRVFRVAGRPSVISFTGDSRHFIYAYQHEGMARVAIDDAWESPPYDDIDGVLVFDSPTTVAFAARRGREILRVAIDIAAVAR
jgi:hypothetical protein